MACMDRYYFRKQFLIVPHSLEAIREKPRLSGWNRIHLSGGLLAFYHPDLMVARATAGRNDVLCLGIVLDSENPGFDNHAIARTLCTECDDFRALEGVLARLAGRWVIIAKLGERIFLYHDAGGLKSVFILRHEQFAPCAASHSGLLAYLFGLTRVRERDEEMKRIGATQWPVYIYPYDNVSQLLPNHRLKLPDCEMERYWPAYRMPRISVDDAAARILGCISDIMVAAAKRAPCFVGLTGGYDSRLLLAADKSIGNRVGYFTIEAPATPRHDIAIPRRLAKIRGVSYRRARFIACSPELLNILRTNSSGLFMQSKQKDACSLAAVVGDGMQLPATVAEVLRCFYYKGGKHPRLSVDELANRSGFTASAMARRGLAEWLGRLPDSDIAPLDLFYWEHRVGVWASASYAFKEALVDTCPPLNCRRLLEIGLAVDVKYRRQPYDLFRLMYSLADRRLLKPRFNDTLQERAADRLSQLPVLWRLARFCR